MVPAASATMGPNGLCSDVVVAAVMPGASLLIFSDYRRPRRKGRATTAAERRALAKANARPDRPAIRAMPGFALLHVDGGARREPGPAGVGYLVDDEAGTRSDSRLLIAHVNGERQLRNPRLLTLEAQIADR